MVIVIVEIAEKRTECPSVALYGARNSGKDDYTIGTDLACSSVRCHAALRCSFVAAVLQADDLVALGELIGREHPPVLVRHLDADRWSLPVLLLCLLFVFLFKFFFKSSCIP